MQSLREVIKNYNGAVFVFPCVCCFKGVFSSNLNCRVRVFKVYLLVLNCRRGMSPRRMAETKGTDGCP